MQPIDPLDYIVLLFRPEDLDGFPLQPGALPKNHVNRITAYVSQAFQKCQIELESATLSGWLNAEITDQCARMELLIDQPHRLGLQASVQKFTTLYTSIKQ